MSLKILDTSLNKMISNIFKGFINKINTLFSSRNRELRETVRKLVIKHIQNSDTYKEIESGGPLCGELGIPAGRESEFVEHILPIVYRHIDVRLTKFALFGFKVNGGVQIYLDDAVYEDLINNPQFRFTYTKLKTGEIIELPWMEWLLVKGSEVIIGDHHVHFELGVGRSGQAIMYPTKVWMMPAKHQGTREKNFLTRALGESTTFANELGHELLKIMSS